MKYVMFDTTLLINWLVIKLAKNYNFVLGTNVFEKSLKQKWHQEYITSCDLFCNYYQWNKIKVYSRLLQTNLLLF